MVKKYYKCVTCNLTFKDFPSAIEHKIDTIHTISSDYFPSRYEPFPPFQLETNKEERIDEILPFEESFIGESNEPGSRYEYYTCLTCRLTFKSRQAAEEHRTNSRHKLVRENYPIGPQYPKSYEKIEQVIGSNIDYEAFFQRTIDDVPNEN